MKLKRELLNAEMAKLYSRFISLFENLLPLSNSQVYFVATFFVGHHHIAICPRM
jgi:hypothetical protein